jgi:predicted nucleic acid-binding protein
MIHLFVDSDIILDLLAKREPYYIHAAKLFTLIDQQEVTAYTSPIVFANLHYLLKKMSSNKSALKSLRKLKTFINVLPTDERVIEQSSNSDFSDFEDAIQYFTSVNNGINLIITRNTKDFKKGKISISTAEEFIKTWEIEHSNEDNENEE